MKRRLIGTFMLVGLSAFGGSVAFGQSQTARPVSGERDKGQTVRSIAGDKWVITAEAGGVNHVEGGVKIARLAGKSGLLMKGDSVDVGDRVSTDINGRAEILLNPGSYVRLAGDSEFEFKSTALEDLKIAVNKGSAIFEVFATDDFRVIVEAPNGKYDLIESGVYRIDVLGDGNSRLEVWKGKAMAGDTKLKGGRSVTSADDAVAMKFDRDEKDEFELWSRTRAKDLAKTNNQLKDREMRKALMRSFLGGRWNTYDSFGLWVYSAQFGRYCFLPFGYGWSSPYGFGFGADIWWYGLPSVIFRPPVNTAYYTGGTNSAGGSKPVSGAPAGPVQGTAPTGRPALGGRGGGRREAPPFMNAQGGRSTGGRGNRPIGAGEGGISPSSGFPSGAAIERSPAFTPAPRMSPRDDSQPSRGGGNPATSKGRSPID